jgi:hypothetical protein
MYSLSSAPWAMQLLTSFPFTLSTGTRGVFSDVVTTEDVFAELAEEMKEVLS